MSEPTQEQVEATAREMHEAIRRAQDEGGFAPTPWPALHDVERAARLCIARWHLERVAVVEAERDRLATQLARERDDQHWHNDGHPSLSGPGQEHCRICLRADLKACAETLRHAENFCPCGARPESLRTHPHVLGCPVEITLARPGVRAAVGERA